MEKTYRKIKPENLHIQEVFLLSKAEYEAHRNNIVPMNNWWLRSPGVNSDQAVCVDYNGNIHCDKHVCNTAHLRPALKIKNLLDFKIGDVFEMEEHTWTVISKDIALCDESIEQAPFDYRYHSSIHEPSNIYEISYARKALKDWARVHGIKCIAERKISPEELEIDDISLLTADEYHRYFNYIKPIGTRWWLRTPGTKSDYYAAYVEVDGSVVNTDGHCIWLMLPVRLSLVVRNIQALNLAVGDSFEMADYTWSVISEEIILCDSAVGKPVYSKELGAEDADKYELSDVSKWAESNGIRCTEKNTEKQSNIWNLYISVFAFVMTAALRYVGFSFITSLLICISTLTIIRLIVNRTRYQQKSIPRKDRENTDEQPVETDDALIQPTGTDNADTSSVKLGVACVKRIREKGTHISDTQVRKKLDTMGDILDSIFEEAEERPSCTKKLDTLINYYLPTIVKFLDVYLDMEQLPAKSEFVKQSQKDIETSFDKYNEAFTALLTDLYKEKVEDISTDMTAMDNLMLQQGLLPDALELIRREEAKSENAYETSSNNAGTSQPDISEENSEAVEKVEESGQAPVSSDDTLENKPVAVSLGRMANVYISHGMTTYDSGPYPPWGKRIGYVRSQYCQEQGMFSIGQARSTVILTRKDDTTN